MDLVLQYLYKLDYNDSPSATENTRDSISDGTTEAPSGNQSATPLEPTSSAAEEQSGSADEDEEPADEDGEPADDSTQNHVIEGLKEVSVSPSHFARLFGFAE